MVQTRSTYLVILGTCALFQHKSYTFLLSLTAIIGQRGDARKVASSNGPILDILR